MTRRSTARPSTPGRTPSSCKPSTRPGAESSSSARCGPRSAWRSRRSTRCARATRSIPLSMRSEGRPRSRIAPGAIAYLDEAGIDVAVPSSSSPGVHFGDDAAARKLARQVNEYLAELKHDHPDRFGAFAALPPPDVEGTLEQIAYAFDVLELDGV